MKKLILFVILLFSISFILLADISAFSKSTNLGNISNTIDANYPPNSAMSGWINISLKDEPSDSLFTVFNSSIKILEVLRLNGFIQGTHYNCSTPSCNQSYSSTDSGSSSLSFTLNNGDKKIIGLKIPEDTIENVNSLYLNFSSSSSSSCNPPIKIDVGNDGIYDWIYNKPKSAGDDLYCLSENYGCYQTSTNLAILDTGTQYCQYINVSAAPGFLVGAILNGSGGANISLSIENTHSCSVAVSNSGVISCNIRNFSTYNSESLYVCVGKISGSGEYKIYYDSSSPVCGDNNKDFSIFLKTLKYDSPGNVLINSSMDQVSFASLAYEYLDKTYNRDCSSGCYIPIGFYSSQDNQQITLNRARLTYNTGISLATESLYNLNQQISKINMKFSRINLSTLNLKVPSSPKNYSAAFKLGGSEILTKTITVLSFPEIDEVYPLEVPAGANVYFTALVSNGNVTSYKWSFGDNSSLYEVSSNHISHKYNEIKHYNLTLYVSNDLGQTQKSFDVNVISPKNYLPSAFASYKYKISSIRNQTNLLPALTKNYIEKRLDLAGAEVKIASLESKYRTVNSTLEYIDIANSLLTIDIPKGLSVTPVSSGKFISNYDLINVNTLRELTTESIEGTDDSIKKALAEWSAKSISVSMDSRAVFVIYENSSTALGSYFNVKVAKRGDSDVGKVFIVIPQAKSSLELGTAISSPIDFNGSEGFSIDVSSGEKSFDFLVLNQNIMFLDAPIYFSPPLSEISAGYNLSLCNFNAVCDSGENSTNCRADCKPWGKIILWLLILIIVFLTIYIACQEWYKRRYEDYLFKDKNDLFNLIHFISNAEKQNLGKEEIFSKLKEKNWHSEQLVYAYKKFKGERTGMLEIPTFGIFDSKKINREIDIRNKVGINPKAIPRPTNVFVKQQTFFGKPLQSTNVKIVQQKTIQQPIKTSQNIIPNSLQNKALIQSKPITLPQNKEQSPNLNQKEQKNQEKSAEQKTLPETKKEEPKK